MTAPGTIAFHRLERSAPLPADAGAAERPSVDDIACLQYTSGTTGTPKGAIMSCRIVGVLLMEDEHGGDEKLIAVPSTKLIQRYAKIENYSDLPQITLQQIEHFFGHYKDLEPNKWVKIIRWGDAEEARKMVMEGVERARAAKG